MLAAWKCQLRTTWWFAITFCTDHSVKNLNLPNALVHDQIPATTVLIIIIDSALTCKTTMVEMVNIIHVNHQQCHHCEHVAKHA